MKINKKFALPLPKQDFYSFKLCTKKGFLKQACGSWNQHRSGGPLGHWPTRPSSLNPPLNKYLTQPIFEKG